MDRQDITMFGRGITNAADYDRSLTEWLPGWFQSQGWKDKLIILLGIVSALAVCYFLVRAIRGRKYEKAVFMAVSLGGLLFWMASAPLMRYGEVYFFIMMAIALGEWQFPHKEKWVGVLAFVLLVPLLGLYISKIGKVLEYEHNDWISQPTYLSWQASQYDVDGWYIWLPDDGDQIGYLAFPGASSAKQLKTLRLRGDSLKEGFYHGEKRELQKVE
jgi:hypothetical protein